MDLKKELGGVADAVTKIMMGEKALHPNQQKLDVHEPEKDELTADDFKKLRAGKKAKEVKKEEVEQIEELKKSTLGSYVKKASKDIADRSFDHGEDEHRQYGMGDDAERDAEVERNEKKIATRQQGINRAATKLSKEEVEQIDELSNKTLYSYLRKTGAVRSSTEVHPRNTSNVPHDLQYQAQDSAKSRINARKGHGSVAPKGYAKEEVQMEDAVGLAKPKTGLTAAAKTLAPQTRVAEASKPPFDKPYTTIKGTITDKSGAKHTPMSRARDIARMAMKKQIEKMKQPVKESLNESRRMEIVREAMKVAKKKKETMAADDKYQADPILSSQITKT